jgi:hypothetical protein
MSNQKISLDAVKKFAEKRENEELKYITAEDGTRVLIPARFDATVTLLDQDDQDGVLEVLDSEGADLVNYIKAIIFPDDLAFDDGFSMNGVHNGCLVLYTEGSDEGYHKFTDEEVEEMLSYN